MSVSILVVDDEPDIAELFRQRFRREVRQGVYGPAFRRILRRGATDACRGDQARTDCHSVGHQHGRDGRAGALLHEIKQRWPDLSVTMVTAYGDEERRRQAERCGALEFITKPVDFEFLKTQLRQLPTAAA